MVCIAAFIILSLIGIFVAFLSIFQPTIGKRYWKIFQKSWACISKKVRLQKCETGFKDDIKNTILSKVVIKHPKWTKPLSLIIEILSIAIVLITIWSLATALKSLLALWALGTCNVTKPTTCSLGSDICSIDEAEPRTVLEKTTRWFTEWNEIFSAIPDKFRHYDSKNLGLHTISARELNCPAETVLDILDPGCTVCVKSYQNHLSSAKFQNYNIRIVPFAIPDHQAGTKFKNSELIVRYLFAIEQTRPGQAIQLLEHIFTARDAEDVLLQTRFNEDYDSATARQTIHAWLTSHQFTPADLDSIDQLVNSDQISQKLADNRRIILEQIHLKGIPTTIYDGKKHTGLTKP